MTNQRPACVKSIGHLRASFKRVESSEASIYLRSKGGEEPCWRTVSGQSGTPAFSEKKGF